MRAFIAIELPKDIGKSIHDFQSKLKKHDILQGIWTNEYHLTLKFLGDIEPSQLHAIESSLLDISAETKGFQLEISGVGAFPSKNFVRVLWAGVGAGYDEALALHGKIDSALEKLDFAKETRYENHITLCRVQKVSDKMMLKEVFERPTSFGSFKVSEIKLIKSTLSEHGPVYEVLKTFNLV